MAVSGPTITQIGPTRFRADYSSDLVDPTFYIYINSELVETTKAESYTFSVPAGGQASIEVFDDPDDVPRETYGAQAILRWEGVNGASSYQVQQYVDSAWTTVALVPASATPHYEFTTAPLADCVTHQFRVRALDGNSNTGEAREFTFEMVRRPDAPSVSATWDAVAGEFDIA